jgi:phenylalanyl-tRNA synthetase alpha subunit
MPKKTKKQKVLSEYRKKIQEINIQTNQAQNLKYSPQTPQNYIEKKATQPVTYVLNDYEKQLAKFTFSDLRKTIIISLIILVLEFLIFFANLNHTYIF